MGFGLVMNYWAVLVAAVASMALGMLWYGPLFGKQWMAMMGFTMKSMKKMGLSPMQAMGIAFVAQLVVASVLSFFVGIVGATTIAQGAQLAFWLWLGFSAPLLLGSFLWEGKSFKLWLFNAAYRLVELVVMASIVAMWR